MDKKYLEKYWKQNIRIKINLKNGYFYEGYILGIENNTLLFKDRFNEEIPIDLDAVSYVIPAERRGKNGNS